MSERELRLLRGIRDSLIAIQEEIRSIRNQQERQGEQYDIRPVWLDPIITAHQKAETYRTTNDNRQYRVQNSLRWATWLAFIAAAAYAGISRYQLGEVQKQTAIAEQQSRPWIKIVEVTLNSPETMSYNNPSMMMDRMTIYPGETLMLFAPVQPAIARADIRTTFHLKNIGKSVAQDIRGIAELFFISDSAAFNAVTKEQDRFCGLKDINDGATTIVSRSALFPEDTFTALIHATGWPSKDEVSHREGHDWVRPVVIGCFAYQFPRNFQTRVAYTVAGLKSSDVGFRTPLSADDIRFIRDERYEYAQ
jgi:hypothetical protein